MIAGHEAMPHAYQNQPLAEILPVARRRRCGSPPVPPDLNFASRLKGVIIRH